MSRFPHNLWYVILGSLALAWLLLITIVHFAAVWQSFSLLKSGIHHENGCAYIVVLNQRPLGWPVTTFVGDTLSDPRASRLTLFEDGKPVGHPHTLHDEIRKKGLGNYSHWSHDLYFSATDCSDPRTNGRTYTVSIPVELSTFGYASALLALIIFVWIVRRNDLVRCRSGELFAWTRKAFATSLLPRDISRPTIVGMALFLLLILYVGSFLVYSWHTGTSPSLSVAGFYQVSDASDYWFCSNSLLDRGNFGSEWCLRRAIYPNFLSGMAFLAGRNIFVTLLLQAFVVCAALFVFIRRSALYVGTLGAAVCTVLLVMYAANYLFPLTMTENAGMIFGCVGLAMLLKASENKSLTWVAGGIALISIGLNARAGAFFMLPCLVLWAGMTAYLSRQNVMRWIMVSSVSMLAGFFLQAAVVLAVGGHPGSSLGNFSYTLYGLAVGGKGWSQVLIDHPALSKLPDAVESREIYALAWKAFVVAPHLFFQGLAKNLTLFLSMGTYGYPELGRLAGPVKILWWVAWIPLLLKYRNPAYLLVALSSLGIAASAPLILGDGRARIFAASVVVDVLQISIGLHFVGSMVIGVTNFLFGVVPRKLTGSVPQEGWVRKYMEPLAGALCLAIVLIPYTPLRHLEVEKQVQPASCPAGEEGATVQIGRGGTLLLDVLPDHQPADFLYGEVNHKNLIQGLPDNSWWGPDMQAFGTGSLLEGYNLDKNAAFPDTLYSAEHLSMYQGHLVHLCIDKTGEKSIFGNTYRKLSSINVLH